jgi:hypothetical protein
MRDVALWDALHREGADSLELVPLLEELAGALAPRRAIFLAGVLGLVTHRSPRVRAAATKVLGGCASAEAMGAVVHRLDDDRVEVRAAAVEALAASCGHDAAPFACALFHRRKDVRRLALQSAPPRLPLGHQVLLLAFDEHQADVRALLDRRAEDGALIPALLLARRRGLLPDDEVMARLARLPWGERASEIIGAIGYPAIADAHVATPEALRSYLTTIVHTDPLAEALSLLWAHPAGHPAPEAAKETSALSDQAPIVEALIGARRARRLKDAEHRRLAVAAALVLLTRGTSSPRMLALCALAVPAALLLEADPARRRAALTAVLDVTDGMQADLVGKAPSLKLLHDSGVLFDDPRTPDIVLVAAALRLLADAPYQKLRDVIPTTDLVKAFWSSSAPAASRAALVSLPPRSPADREAYRALVRAIVDGMRTAAPDVIAALTVALPAEGAFILEEIERRRAGLAGKTIALLLADSQPALDALTLRHLERNAALVAAQLTAASLPEALAAAARICRRAFSGAPPAALAAAEAVLRAATKGPLATALATMGAAELSDVVNALNGMVLPLEAERAWAVVLERAPLPEARAWAAPRLAPSDAPRAIGAGLLAQLRAAADAKLPLAASIFLREPLTGLVEALGARALPRNARLAASLLASHDPPHLVADAFEAVLEEQPAFLAAIDAVLLEESTRMDLPLLATAWVHHDAAHAVRFEHHCRTAPGGLRSIVDLALALPSPSLSWKMMRGALEVVRAWTFQRRALLATLDDRLAELLFAILAGAAAPRPPTRGSSAFPAARGIRRFAAELVALAHGSGKAEDFVAEVRARLLERAPAIEDDLRATLRPVAEWTPRQTPASASSSAGIERGRERLFSFDAHVVRAAVDALQSAGAEGRAALVQALAAPEPPPCLKPIVERVILDDESAPRLLAPEVDAEVRFRVALRLGEIDAAVAAALAPTRRPWLDADDVGALFAPHTERRLSARTLAVRLATSPHPPAYTKAAWSLLSIWHDERASDAREGLFAFLAVDDERDESLRAEVAAALLGAGTLVAPVILRTVLTASIETRHADLLRESIPRSLWLEVIAAARIAGDRSLDARLETLLHRRLLDDDVGAALALHLLNGAVEKEDAAPLFAVVRRARVFGDPRIEALRAAVEWGTRQSRRLLSRAVSIELIHDAFGYTRLHQPRIFVNPLPLLRNERGGDDVFRGLIVHEIGHHLYHADELGRGCWAEAQTEGIASLLNLVADEHLERNLRAESEVYGDHLKVLAAYAFQHASHDVWLEHLLNHLGREAALILARVRLLPGRAFGCLHVELGKLLAELAGHSSFARFIRSLRMGLGARGADEKVKTALALFEKKQFRHSKMDWLLEIARELKRLFGDETKILDTFGLHEILEAGEGDLMAEGFSPDELQRELDRKQGRRESKIEKPRFNDSPEETFEPIDQLVPLVHNAAEHRLVADQGKRATRAMRAVFDELGVRLVTEHKRLSGRSVDRQGLGNAVLRRDARLLVRRQPVPATDLFVGVLVDCSGSMASEQRMDKARVFATSLAEAARGHRGVDVRIFGFTDEIIYEAGDAERCAAHALTAGGGNNDAAALWHAAVQARRSRRKKKLLVMVSDGMPTECSATALRSLALRLERSGMMTAQVAVRPIEEKMFKHYVEILGEDIDDAARRFARTISRLVRKTVGA